jgi:hypothetical protein
MKSLKFLSVIAIAFAVTLSSCKKEDVKPDPTPTSNNTPPPNGDTTHVDSTLNFKFIPINTGAFAGIYIYNDSNQVVCTKTATPIDMMNLCADPVDSIQVPKRIVTYTVKGFNGVSYHTLGTMVVNGNDGFFTVNDISAPPDPYTLHAQPCGGGIFVLSY